jgi:hypothetical protein
MNAVGGAESVILAFTRGLTAVSSSTSVFRMDLNGELRVGTRSLASVLESSLRRMG